MIVVAEVFNISLLFFFCYALLGKLTNSVFEGFFFGQYVHSGKKMSTIGHGKSVKNHSKNSQ